MLYKLCYEGDEFLLVNEVNYTKKQFESLIKIVKYDLSHHVNSEDILRILCQEYSFKYVEC